MVLALQLVNLLALAPEEEHSTLLLMWVLHCQSEKHRQLVIVRMTEDLAQHLLAPFFSPRYLLLLVAHLLEHALAQVLTDVLVRSLKALRALLPVDLDRVDLESVVLKSVVLNSAVQAFPVPMVNDAEEACQAQRRPVLWHSSLNDGEANIWSNLSPPRPRWRPRLLQYE